MKSNIKTFFASFLVLFVLDFIWLGFVTNEFNTERLAPIARMSEGHIVPDKVAAVLAYLVMALSMTLFVVPKLKGETLNKNFAWGAALGFVIYAIYDCTNYAILKDYSISFALVDVAWGTTVYGISAVILSRILTRLNN